MARLAVTYFEYPAGGRLGVHGGEIAGVRSHGGLATIAYLERLDGCGDAFKSYTEPFLDTDNELIAHIVLGVTSYYAQQEALRISERMKAGLERARRRVKVLGRPDGFERSAPVLPEMKEQEFSQGRMSRETGLSYNTVKKYLGRLDAPTVPPDQFLDGTGRA